MKAAELPWRGENPKEVPDWEWELSQRTGLGLDQIRETIVPAVVAVLQLTNTCSRLADLDPEATEELVEEIIDHYSVHFDDVGDLLS